jgi:anti-sigma B factor antagonist
MQFEREVVGDIVVIRIKEARLTSQEAPELKTMLLGMLAGEPGEYFLINLENIEYMDSTGLGGFLFGIRQAERYDKELLFCGMKPRIQSLMRIAHLEQVLEVYNSEAEAVKAIQEEEGDLD